MDSNARLAAALAACALFVPLSAPAADTGELWESSVTMNMPGMPAGMGAQSSRICREKNESPGPGRNDCKVSNLRRSGLTESMTVTCPDGTMTLEMTYNAARTEYKGTMKMDGMVMNLTGRKVGACDPQVARREQNEKMARMEAQAKKQQAEAQRQASAMQAELAAAQQAANAKVTEACSQAAKEMNYQKFPGELCLDPREQGNELCRNKKSVEALTTAEVRAACRASRSEFCQKLQTPAGYEAVAGSRAAHETGSASTGQRIVAERVGEASAFCGLRAESVTAGACAGAAKSDRHLDMLAMHCPAEARQVGASACPKAAQQEAYAYLTKYCSAEAKSLYSKNCAGRDYTAAYEKADKKMFRMCAEIALALEDEGGLPTQARRQPGAAPAQKKGAVDSVTDGVNQGINKLKGLFGR